MLGRLSLPPRPAGQPSGSQWASRPPRPPVPVPAAPDSPSAVSLLRGSPADGAAGPSGSQWSSPPRRPLASSWSDSRSVGFSGAAKLDQVIALVDVDALEEDPDGPDGGGGGGLGRRQETRVEEDARQLARLMGAERLYDEFQDWFGEGPAPVAKLAEVFAAAGLAVSPEQLAAAVAVVHPELSPKDTCLSFPQCQEVFLHLQQERRKSEDQQQQLGKAGRIARWVGALTDREATNLLLFIVVTLCCLSAFLAGGLAILLLFLDSISSVNSRLAEDLGIVEDTMNVFGNQLAPQVMQEQAQMFITTLSSVLQHIVYNMSMRTKGTMLLEIVTSVSNTFSAWLYNEPQQSFVNFALLVAQLANTSLVKYGQNGTKNLFDEVNGGLADGYEVLLARWLNNRTAAVEYLTAFRLAGQCTNGCDANTSSTALMRTALAGSTFAQMAMDYRPSSVYAGFSSTSGLGVEVSVDWLTLILGRFDQMNGYLDAWTAAANYSYEFLVAYSPSPGVESLISTPAGCDAACAAKTVAPGTPLNRALRGETGTMQFTNFRGVRALAAFSPIANSPLGLAVQVPLSDIVTGTIRSMVDLVNILNSDYPSQTEEFEVSSFSVQGNTTTFQHLSAYRYGDQCPAGQCVVPPYVQQAAANCSSGVLLTTDYRGNVTVLVGFNCFSELNAVLSYKFDESDADARVLASIVEAVNDRTAKDNATSAQYLVATPKAGLTAADVRGYDDFTVVSKIKYPKSCVNPGCAWKRESALLALQDREDVVETRDYRNVAVKAAPSRCTAVDSGVGLALELDSKEAMQDTVNTAIIVGCFAIGMVVGSTVVLIVVTKLFLQSMITAREEGKRAVEVEKNRFSGLVASMYPAYVVPRLLAGEKQMVCEVPGAAVFFSDIHEFTSASNTLGSKELLQLVGYVYGVMDEIADRFGVYKVKTIGDAYLAVLGLPGSESANPSLDLLRFASCVCQVFGNRFVHPVEGQVLALMNKQMAWNGRQGRKARPSKALNKSGTSLARGKSGDAAELESSSHWPQRLDSVVSSTLTDSTEASQRGSRVQCIMSYGLAVGKLVAGVLAGRCPMFDIWGVTVNLASRMQSTGEPGRIQVSEHLYNKVVGVPGQPFTFEAPRKAFCKGFGNINAYMVRTTSEGLPKDLQEQLRLEPRYGAFHFDNFLAKLSGPEASKGDGPKGETPRPGTPPAQSPVAPRQVSIVLPPGK